MYTGQMVFSQLMDFLPKDEFIKCVHRYQGNYRVREFPASINSIVRFSNSPCSHAAGSATSTA